MSLFDSFFLLFKTNAKEAQKDVEAFGKATENVQDKLNRTDQTAGKLGASFSKLALAGITALEGFDALGKLKDNLVGAVNYNAEIEKTARLTGINARQLSIWNDVVARAGGNPGSREYLNFITNLNKQYGSLGINTRLKGVNMSLGELADKIKELNAANPGSGYALAQKFQIPDDFYLALKDGKENLQQMIDLMGKLDHTSDESAGSALRLKQAWVDMGVAISGFLSPVISKLEDSLSEMFEFTAALFSGDFKKAGTYLNSFSKAFPAYGTTKAPSTQPGAPGANQAESAAYWKSQGYSDAQIAALLANEKAESSFDPSTVGDGGTALGIFQWHQARRRRILAATGIDVATASHADQLRAASWELNDSGTASQLRAASTPGQGAAILTGYEAPANAAYQALVRGQSADSFYAQMIASGQNTIASANATPLAGSSTSNQKTVTIGSITITTQATDANGIATDLRSELASTVGAFDDGVKH